MEIVFAQFPSWKRWFDDLPLEAQDETEVILSNLEQFGSALGMPQSKPLGDGLHELRYTINSVRYRIMYSMKDGTAYVLSQCTKTNQGVHDRAIRDARRQL